MTIFLFANAKMEASTDLFINIIRNHRIIYDTRSKDFKNLHKKEDEWILIANESRMSVEAAKKRYSSLRQKYSREKKKEIVCYRTKQIFRPSVFFDRLSFLEDFVKPRRTYTNDVDGVDLVDHGVYDDPDDQCLDADGYTHHSTFFGDEYSLAQEQADDREALAEMERDGLLSDDVNEIEYLEEVEVSQLQAAPILRSVGGSQQFVLNLNENSVEIDALLQRRLPNGFGSTSTQSRDLSDNCVRQQSGRFSSMDYHEGGHNGNSQPLFHLSKSIETHHENRNDMSTSQLPDEAQRSYNVSDNINIGRATQPGIHSSRQEHSSVSESVEFRRDGPGAFRQPEATQVALTINRNQPTGRETSSIIPKKAPVVQAAYVPNPTSRVTSSILSKSSPVVQAVSASHQKTSQNKADSTASMDAIKEKMVSYLAACNDKLQNKPDRSPHARFLSYLGSKLENVPKEKVEELEEELLKLTFRYSKQS